MTDLKPSQLPAKTQPDFDGAVGFGSTDRLPLTGAHINLNSNLYTISRAVNPLVAAAGPLMTMASHLLHVTQTPDAPILQEQLQHEMRVFENKAQNLGYRAQLVLAARYLLCSVLDELVETTDWGRTDDWQQHSLLLTFQGETWGGERSFFILDRAAEDPAVYLDLLELAYLCISLGYQGKYRRLPDGHTELNVWTENLYQIITHQRGETSKQLLIPPPPQSKKSTTSAPLKLPPWWVSVFVGVVALIGVYWIYSSHLNQMAAPVTQAINQM